MVTSFTKAGSNDSIKAETNLKNLFSSNNLTNMPVTSHSVTTAGGSNNIDDNGSGDDDNGSGLSTTAIIVLAVVVPICVIGIFRVI